MLFSSINALPSPFKLFCHLLFLTLDRLLTCTTLLFSCNLSLLIDKLTQQMAGVGWGRHNTTLLTRFSFVRTVYFHLDVKSSANRKGVESEERSFNHVLKLLNHISVSTVSKSTFIHRVTMGAQAGHLKPFSSKFWSVSLIANMALGTSSVQYKFWISYVAKSWIATGINMPKIWHVSCRALWGILSHVNCVSFIFSHWMKNYPQLFKAHHLLYTVCRSLIF